MFSNPTDNIPKGWRKIIAFNWVLFGLVCVAVSISVLMLYGVANGDADEWAVGQAQRFGIGVFLIFFIAFMPSKFWKYCSIPIYIATLIMIIYTAMFGIEVNGSRRWVDIGPMRLQASEFAKMAIILMLANYYSILSPKKISNPVYVLPALLIMLAPASLVVLQPDLGTSLFILLCGLGVLFLAGVHWGYYASGIVFGIFLMAIVGVGLVAHSENSACRLEEKPIPEWLVSFAGSGVGQSLEPLSQKMIKPYQYDRIYTFLDPQCDPTGDGWQIIQSQIALGSGGLKGLGFMQGTQSRLNFLSENHTDFIFTSYAENFGYVGTVFLLSVFGLISLSLGYMSIRSRDRYAALVTGGVGVMFFLFYMINMAMVMGMMPVVGVPLPFISYGGSAMLVLCIGIGFAQNAYIHRPRGDNQ